MSRATLGVVAALAAEARQLERAVHRGGELAVLADGTSLAVTGVGRDAAAEGARALIARGCGALASWGLAGGLDPSLAAGSLVLPREVALEGGLSMPTAAPWRDRVEDILRAARLPVGSGKLLTAASALRTTAAKSRAFLETGAAAVDMESFAVAQAAAARGLPFIALRAVVDTAADEVPAALASAADASGRLSTLRLLARLAAQPSALAALPGLAARYRAAIRSLRAAAAAGALGASRR